MSAGTGVDGGPMPEQFDPVLHSGPRITILSRLAIHRSMRFAALQRSTTLSAGNLSAHLDVLEKAGHVAQDVDERKVVRRKVVRITPWGDDAFRAYVRQVRSILEGVESRLDDGEVTARPSPARG